MTVASAGASPSRDAPGGHGAAVPIQGGHLDALTGIRGIAAWSVVIYHLRTALTHQLPDWLMHVLAKGYLAVDMFFMLSGFVIWYNYAGKLETGGWDAVPRFWWRRLARIWPLHGLVLAGFAVFALAIALRGRPLADYPLAQLPLQLLLLQNWGLTSELAWNVPSWSISTEMAAYVFFPLIALRSRWQELAPPALLLRTAIALILLAAMFLPLGGIGVNLAQMGLWRCLVEFGLGNLLCLLWSHWRTHPNTAWLSGLACSAAVAAGIGFALPEVTWVPVAFFTGLLALATGKGPIVRLLAATPLRTLGEISYSTYLAHYLLFILFKIVAADAQAQITLPALAVFVALLLAVSVALYQLVERPAQAWMTARPPQRLIPALA
ncbi:MAG: acyltransferase [Sphingomonadales bacterium]|nr:acyltransferase [Sphingomonadales bacterium]